MIMGVVGYNLPVQTMAFPENENNDLLVFCVLEYWFLRRGLFESHNDSNWKFVGAFEQSFDPGLD